MAEIIREHRASKDLIPEELIEERIVKVTGDIQTRRYSRGRLLGKGGFAKCYEITSLDSKKTCAVKIVQKSSLNKSRAKQKLISEIKIHKSLHHPNIVDFEHYFEDSENVYILLEMCQNQSLNELLKRRKKLTEIEVQNYMLQIIKALKYLHSHRVIHRDLKLGNLFLTDKMEVKVGDFGLATKLEFEGERKRTVCGTPNYIAPEVLDGKQGHSYEVDIWSLGVICYTLIIGKPPFETQDVKTTYKRIKMNAYNFPETAAISDAAKSLITEILVTDPWKRPTLEQILKHEFFSLGTSIPKLLPTSTLACPPSLSYIKQFMPDVGTNGVIMKNNTQRPYIESNTNVEIDKKFYGGFKQLNNKQDFNTEIKETISSQPLTINYEKNKIENIFSPNEKAENKEELINDKKLVISSQVNNSPQFLQGPDIWVKKWVDYSSKYGLGYLLSNNQSGVFFNDSSKILLVPKKSTFYYIERRPSDKQEVIYTHSLNDYPKELNKKVTLLQHFRNYLEGESVRKENDECRIEEDVSKRNPNNVIVYVKKWLRTRHALMFRLSNKIVQVCFQDHTEIILSSESRVVTYVNKKDERTTYQLSSALESNNIEMTKRLKYTKDILTQMLSINHIKDNINSEPNQQINTNFNLEEKEH